MRALLFPGQGSQVVGMGKQLYDNYQSARDVFDEVDDVLDFKLTQVMFNGPEEDLLSTENAQPAIMTCSMAIMKVLQKEYNFSVKDNISYLAGHSLGEYSALCVANVFDLRTAAKLLKIRGEAMKHSTPNGLSGMVALLGLKDLDKIQELIDATKKTTEVCVIANDNCEGQVVVSGHTQSLQALIKESKNFGVKIAKELKVSGAFHSPLMITAAKRVAESLQGIEINNANIPIISNVIAKEVRDYNQIKELLVEQVVKSVLWRESMNYLVSKGVTEVIEVGQGNVLSGLMKRIEPNVSRINLDSVDQIENFMK